MTQGSSLTARSERLWLLGILLLVVALRFIAAGSDPMPELDAGFISDSGTWWKNPKQHLLWGQWIMDDGNFGILTAPAHALAQRAVFGLFGLGYAQGFLLSGVSGVVSTVLVFGLVRREHDAVPALLAAAFAGIDVLMLAYDRAAYPEPFQLMLMLAAVGAVLASRGRAWLAALGGVAVVAVLLAKPPGLVLAPIAATAWLALWITDRVREPSAATPAQFQWRGFALYTATAAVLVAFVGLVFLRPYAADVWLHFQQQMSDGQALGARVTDRVLLFGTPLGFRLNHFFRYEWYLLVAAGVFGAARIARVIRRRVTAVEVAAWLWVLLGLGVMGLQSYQQDRRFLFLVPPLAMLSAIALAHAVELGESAWQSLRARRLAMGGAGAVVALVMLYYLIPFGAWKMIGIGARLGRTWSYGEAGGILLSAMIVGAALLAAVWSPTVRLRGNTTLQRGLAAAALGMVLLRVVPELHTRGHGLRDISRAIDRISREWPAEDRVAVGWTAGTVTLTSHVLPASNEVKGPRASERFRPQLEIYSTSGKPLQQRKVWAVPGRPAKVVCAQLPAWNDARGTPRLTVHILVEPDRLAACQAAVSARIPRVPS